MLKRLLTTTTAIVAFGSAAAIAAQTDANEIQVVFDREIEAGASIFYDAKAAHMLASNLIGSYIYNGTGDAAESIGDVNDVVFSTDGQVMAVIAGVGGFLGIGEKEVAISIDQLNWRTGPEGERWLVGELTSEQLDQAPAFDRSDLTGRQQAMGYGTDAGHQMTADNTDTMRDTRETFVPITKASFEAETLIGMDVHGADDEDVGEIGDVLIGTEGEVEAVIIDVGGFLGLGEKPVAVALDSLMISLAEGVFDWSVIKTDLTAEQLEEHRAFSRAEYDADPQAVILVTPAM